MMKLRWKKKTNPTHNVDLYLGSIKEDSKEEFSYEDLVREIGCFQDKLENQIPVCITSVEFVAGSRYREKGWKISTINYPRIGNRPQDISRFMVDLGLLLLFKFKQNRITVVGETETVMLEPIKKQKTS